MHNGIGHIEKVKYGTPKSNLGTSFLVTSGGDHWRHVHTCSFGTPLLVTSGGDHWISQEQHLMVVTRTEALYGSQAGVMHPTGMLSCCQCSFFYCDLNY